MKYIKLNELCEINIGKTPSRNNSDYWGSGNKWLSISDLKMKYISESKEEITDLAVEKANMKLVPKNTVVMSFKLSIGKTAILKEDMFTNEAIANFQIKNNELITSEYLYYALKTLNFDNTDRAVMGATLNKSKLNDIRIPYCDVKNQNKIVEVLDKAQELIDKRKEQIEALDELVKSRFIEMFGDLKTNPKKWDILSFEEFAVIDTSMTKDFEKYQNYPHIGIDSIEKNTGNILEHKLVKDSNIKSGKYVFDERHIIYSKIRPNLNKVALPDFKGLCSADSYPILCIDGISDRIYLGYVLRSEFFLNYILAFSGRTNIPKVNKEQLKGFNMPVPPIELQNQFADFVKKVDKIKSEIENSLKELEDNFNSLMQRAFKGELFKWIKFN
ncbi:restriction endonuclease subunit S [Romboutsia hominis]|uniref:restriction endonuclease subunit S n=1 Tax=Romboutsia hominis TaxID=1507512 RepID=UPI001F06C20B|nr:restriction endonuclease subunit S [Romboutsia hominis]MCH1959702.1 restriction endonuclease subunit S [Romboutsia hominis]MCH1969875.1 restriction endonuclease subunit S [Romboutsia hominis]